MRKSLHAILGVVALFGAANAHASGIEDSALEATTHVIADIENRPITFHLERLDQNQLMPILLVIDGSGCRGALRKGFASLFRPTPDLPMRYAKLTLTKPGIDPTSEELTGCSEEYRERYSIDRGVLDHLRVLQHLRSASWWNGELYVWGWSDGGDIGARLISYYPNVERAALGAQGGGYTMAQHMEDFWTCAADRQPPDRREACLKSVREWFAEVRERPLGSLGDGESNKLWRSRLFVDLVPLLADDSTPLLVIHGAKDRDSTPVESARLLVARLRERERQNLRYCEVPDMAHGYTNDQATRRDQLERATLHWLFDEDDAETLLAESCDPDPPLEQVAPPTAQ